MSRLARVLIAGTSAATLISAASFAEPTNKVTLEQTNSDANTASDEVNVGVGESVNSTALVQANAATGFVTDWTSVTGAQTFTGSADAVSRVQADDIWSWIISGASAQGNGVTIQSSDHLDMDLEQSAGAGTRVSALSDLRVSDYTAHVIQTATASANAVEVSAAYGNQDINLTQSADGETYAGARLDAENARIEDVAAAVQAAGNSLQVSGYEANPIAHIDQSQTGTVTAETEITARDVRWGLTAATEAAGNTAVITNDWGYAHLQGAQTNTGDVTARTVVNLGEFSNGVAAISAHGVGNNALVSNIGADAYSGIGQVNTGAVTGEAIFTGGHNGGSGVGGGLVVSASAIGNAQSGYICADCPVGLTANINQTNSGPVTARTQINSPGYTPFISSSATAVGNAATFSTRTPN
ncbi:MAG: holdfast anchor protein HfaD [Oceanicaulis sp.]|nr:holdfast anchor protein HfaD [Oceanicaulis sp.]